MFTIVFSSGAWRGSSTVRCLHCSSAGHKTNSQNLLQVIHNCLQLQLWGWWGRGNLIPLASWGTCTHVHRHTYMHIIKYSENKSFLKDVIFHPYINLDRCPPSASASFRLPRVFGKWVSGGDNPKHFGPRIFIVFFYAFSIMKTQKQHTLTAETTERRQHLGSLPILAQTVREK